MIGCRRRARTLSSEFDDDFVFTFPAYLIAQQFEPTSRPEGALTLEVGSDGDIVTAVAIFTDDNAVDRFMRSRGLYGDRNVYVRVDLPDASTLAAALSVLSKAGYDWIATDPGAEGMVGRTIDIHKAILTLDTMR